MRRIKTLLLLIAGSLVVTGCDSSRKKALIQNHDYFLTKEISDENLFYTPTIEEFENLFNSNLSYIVYFFEEGCSSCSEFEPIIKKYIKESHQFVVKIDGIESPEFIEKYKTTFFGEDDALFPSVFVKEDNNNIYKVDYNKYMKTYSVFKHHMKSRYQTGKYTYFSGEITEKSWIKFEFSYLEICINNLYEKTIYPMLRNTIKNVMFAFNEEGITAELIGRDESGNFYSKDQVSINDKTTEKTLRKYL